MSKKNVIVTNEQAANATKDNATGKIIAPDTANLGKKSEKKVSRRNKKETPSLDLYDTGLKERVTAFMSYYLKREENRTIFGGVIREKMKRTKELQKSIDSGNLSDKERYEAKGEIEILALEIEEQKKALKEANSCLKFEKEKGETTLTKNISTAKDKGEVRDYIRAFFYGYYKKKIDDTDFEIMLMDAIGEAFSAKKLVSSDATKATEYRGNAIFQVIFAKTMEYMVMHGAIRVVDIPADMLKNDIKAMFERREALLESRRAEKKAREEARKAALLANKKIEQRPVSELQEDVTDGVTFEKKNNATTTPVSSTENTGKKDEVA